MCFEIMGKAYSQVIYSIFLELDYIVICFTIHYLF